MKNTRNLNLVFLVSPKLAIVFILLRIVVIYSIISRIVLVVPIVLIVLIVVFVIFLIIHQYAPPLNYIISIFKIKKNIHENLQKYEIKMYC
jgi:hypothetical protein